MRDTAAPEPSPEPEDRGGRSAPVVAPSDRVENGDLLARVGKGLRALYLDLLREPIPEPLVALTRKLEAQECGHEVRGP